MAKKKLITLAKELDFETETDYYDYMIDSYINGNRTQCRNLFNAMKSTDKKLALQYFDGADEIYKFYFNLLF